MIPATNTTRKGDPYLSAEQAFSLRFPTVIYFKSSAMSKIFNSVTFEKPLCDSFHSRALALIFASRDLCKIFSGLRFRLF